MIDYGHQELDRMEDAGVPDDIKWLGQRFDAAMDHWSKKVYDALRRQESPNPTVLNMNPGRIFNNTAKMRCYALVFSGGVANEEMSLRVGTASAWEWFTPASPGTFTIPLPIVFDAGVDVQVVNLTAPAHLDWRCRVLAYTELEDGDAV
jgi:hypothetical protein